MNSQLMLTTLGLALCASVAPAQPMTDAQFLTGDYRAIFGRAPDPTGFVFWYQYLPNTVTRDQISSNFLSSGEYCGYFSLSGGCTNPPTDSSFLILLYQRTLNRSPDPTGYNFWLNCELEPNSNCPSSPASPPLTRPQVVADFIVNDPEFVADVHMGVQITPSSASIDGAGTNESPQILTMAYTASNQNAADIASGQVFIGSGSPNSAQTSLLSGCYIEWAASGSVTIWDGTAWFSGSLGANAMIGSAPFCSLNLQQSSYSAGMLTLALIYHDISYAAGSGRVWSYASNVENWPSLPWTGPNVTSISTLTTCISGSSPICNLDPGTYRLSSPLVVGRSGVTITGGGTSPSQTMLVRGRGLILPLVQVGDNGYTSTTIPLTNITIQNLTFCGASTRRERLSERADPNDPCPRTPNMTQCEINGGGCADVLITNTAPGQSWASAAGAPFNNIQPNNLYNVTITNSWFEDSANFHPIFISPNTVVGQKVNDVYINNT